MMRRPLVFKLIVFGFIASGLGLLALAVRNDAHEDVGKGPLTRVSGVIPPAQGERVGSLWTNSIGMKFAKIPAGSFMMGRDQGGQDERPVHRVSINKPFYLKEPRHSYPV